MEEKYFITIGRQLGSGGRLIGGKLASILGIPFYDKELIQIASQQSGLGKELFEKVDETTSHSLLFPGVFGLYGDYYSTDYLSNETLFNIQGNVIRSLAERESAIFVGRCADYVLKDYARCLNVFISAGMPDRVKRIVEYQKVSEKKAFEIIEKIDKKRSGYYNYFSNKAWGVAGSYHLCINSSVLGIDGTANFILEFAKQMFGLEAR